MCGTIKFEGVARKIGNIIVAVKPSSFDLVTGPWSGFIRDDNLSWWQKNTPGAQVMVLFASFTEHGREFTTYGRPLAGYQLAEDIKIGNRLIGARGSIRILTREARNKFERSIHSRWPVVHHDHRYQFKELNVLKGQVNLL